MSTSFKDMSYLELKERIVLLPKNETTLSLSEALTQLTTEEIKEIFKNIPPQIEHLDLAILSYFKKRTTEELAEIFKALPSTLHSIDLEGNNFGSNSINLAAILNALPRSITSLNLESNKLNKYSTEELEEGFKALPPTLNSLSLEDNSLFKKNGDEYQFSFSHKDYEKIPLRIDFQKIFKILPRSITDLNLSDNYLSQLTEKELIQAFEFLPKLISLDLGDNLLSDFNLKDLFKALPHSVVKLNLEKNSLSLEDLKDLHLFSDTLSSRIIELNLKDTSDYGDSALIYNEFFKNFPALRSLNLSNNDLADKLRGADLFDTLKLLPSNLINLNLCFNSLASSKHLGDIVASFPSSLKSLDLSINHLNCLTIEQLETVFKSLPRSLDSLMLFGNDLCSINGPGLEKIFKALPSLSILDLGSNNLHRKTTAELGLIFKSLPDSLVHLHLYNDCYEGRSADEIATLLKSLPASIESLHIYELGDKTKSELKVIFENLPPNLKSIRLNSLFSEDQLSAIAQGIETHTALMEIDWFSDGIEAKDVYKILQRNLEAYQKLELGEKEVDAQQQGSLIGLKDKFNFFLSKQKSAGKISLDSTEDIFSNLTK